METVFHRTIIANGENGYELRYDCASNSGNAHGTIYDFCLHNNLLQEYKTKLLFRFIFRRIVYFFKTEVTIQVRPLNPPQGDFEACSVVLLSSKSPCGGFRGRKAG